MILLFEQLTTDRRISLISDRPVGSKSNKPCEFRKANTRRGCTTWRERGEIFRRCSSPRTTARLQWNVGRRKDQLHWRTSRGRNKARKPWRWTWSDGRGPRRIKWVDTFLSSGKFKIQTFKCAFVFLYRAWLPEMVSRRAVGTRRTIASGPDSKERYVLILDFLTVTKCSKTAETCNAICRLGRGHFGAITRTFRQVNTSGSRFRIDRFRSNSCAEANQERIHWQATVSQTFTDN